MQVRFLEVDTSGLPSPQTPGAQTLHVPTLNAYAVAHASFSVNSLSVALDDVEVKISGSDLLWAGTAYGLEPSDYCVLQIYYYGIRDYSLLFPAINRQDPIRAKRVGNFYKEAEAAFEAEAWLSYMLMCGAIFEHLLYFKLGTPAGVDTLSKVSNAALKQNIIDQKQFDIIDTARRARNVIHCNRLAEPYITRLEAMDARVIIERLMLYL